MTSHDLEELLVRANPVVDPEELRVASDDVEARCASIVARPESPAVPPPHPDMRRRLRRAAAFTTALIGCLVLVGAAVLLTRGAEAPQQPITNTTAPRPTTTLPQPATITPLEAAAKVDELHDAWNAGDVAAVTALLAEPAASDPGLQRTMRTAIDGVGAQLQAECAEPRDDRNPTVTCTVSLLQDRFYTLAGVSWYRTVTYRVTPEGIDTPTGFFWTHPPTGDAYDFLRDFDDWLYERHQDGETYNGWIWVDPDNGLLPNWTDGQPCCIYSVESRYAAERLSELVTEFLDEIGSWPPPEFLPMGLPDAMWLEESVDAVGVRQQLGYVDGELLFTLTYSCPDCFGGNLELTRSPNGVLTEQGSHGGVWVVEAGNQFEISHLWPPHEPAMDVLWLTDYTGATRDILTGYLPEPGETFALLDEIILETHGDGVGRFGLHADCTIDGDTIGAALVGFDGGAQIPLQGWIIDYRSGTFVEVADAATLRFGHCYTPSARSE